MKDSQITLKALVSEATVYLRWGWPLNYITQYILSFIDRCPISSFDQLLNIYTFCSFQQVTVCSMVPGNCPVCQLYPLSGTDYTKRPHHSQRHPHGQRLMLNASVKKREKEKESLVYMTGEKRKREKGENLPK